MKLDDPPLWTGLGLVAPLRARVAGYLPSQIGGVSIDTRTLQPGDLFFAIKGEKNDGHDHVLTAFDKGAGAAVVDETNAGRLDGAGPLLIVRDVLAAMEGLARAARVRGKARIVAVTGSVGKTSTKEALRVVLTPQGATHAADASYNNHWGVPLTLARMPKTARFGVIEIGMNHAGEITPLTAMAAPHVAIVTTVAPVHLEHFSSVEAIADAKAEIFSGLMPGGVAIINRDIEHYQRLADHARHSPCGHIATFGAHERADARLTSVTVERDHSRVSAVVCGRKVSFRIGAPGRHVALNALSVLLAAQAFGVDVEEAAAALAFFAAPAGRGRQQILSAPDGTFTLIDESYNANPASMQAALALTGAIRGKGRRIAVLGDMLELGPKAKDLHADIAHDIATNGIDLVFVAGPLMRHLYDVLPPGVRGGWRSSASELEGLVTAAVHGGDIVMIKGSNGSRMNRIVTALRERFEAPPRNLEAAGMATC